jgi:integrase
MSGSIRPRGAGFQVRVYRGRDPITKKKKWAEATVHSRAEARVLRDRLTAEIVQGTYAPPDRTTLGDFLAEWLDGHVRGHREASTVRGYENIVRHVREAPLGAVPLRDLTPQHFETYYTSLRQAGLSGTTRRNHHRVLSAALVRARKWGRIRRNPAQDAASPQPDTEETAALDEEQLALFLGRAKRESPHYALYLTAARTGMRSSELAGLRWQDVDFRRRRLSVRQAFLRVGALEIWKQPKSKAGRRSIPIQDHTILVLRQVQAYQTQAKEFLGTGYYDRDLVFCQPNGKPLWMRAVLQRDFYPLLERCGLPRVTMHSLRHSFISTGAREKVDPRVMQRLAGHSTITTTLEIYRHVLDTEEEDAIRAIEARQIGGPTRDVTLADGQMDGQQALSGD